MPIKVRQLELAEGIQPIGGLEGYDGVRILVRYHGRPVGWAQISCRGQTVLTVERIRDATTTQLGLDLVPRVFRGAVAAPCPVPTPMSVAVCTRDRPAQLRACLEAILGQDYPAFEVIVIDNAPRTDATARLASEFPVRYAREERPGLNWARNRAIAEARHAVIAYTDDDARPDRGWLRAMNRTFVTSNAAAVTGLVAPAELETAAQIRFELEYGGMGHGFERRVLRRTELSTNGLLWASRFGVGANMAFRKEVFARIGPFDPSLDVGTPAGGGGDVEMFHRIVAAGLTLVYEPAALVWHLHRRDAAAFRRLVFNNGTSFGAYLLTCARNRTVSRLTIAGFFARQWLKWWLLRRLVRPAGYPRHLVAIELLGLLCSPFAYRSARRRACQISAAYGAQLDTVSR